jgi:hypothetical protein
MNAVPLSLRLFLEGIEVPVIAAQVSIAADSPASASIQIVPTSSALNFLPRTLVHLFYLDQTTDEAGKSIEQTEPPREVLFDNGESYYPEHRVQDSRYKLLFCGEVFGYSFQKTPASRQMVLQCMDLSSYWDTCYQWFADYSAQGDGLTDKVHQFVGAGKGLFDNVSGGTDWVLADILKTPPESPEFRNAKGLLGGVIHMLEMIGGIKYRGPDFKGFNGVNDFFSVAELRYNLMGMIGACEADNTSQKLFAHKAFLSWLKNGMTSQGSLLSYRDLLNHVNSYIFHHVYPNPCARYIYPQGPGIMSNAPVTLLEDTTSGPLFASQVIEAYNSAVVCLDKLEGLKSHVVSSDLNPLLEAVQKCLFHVIEAKVVSDASNGATDSKKISEELASADAYLTQTKVSLVSIINANPVAAGITKTLYVAKTGIVGTLQNSGNEFISDVTIKVAPVSNLDSVNIKKDYTVIESNLNNVVDILTKVSRAKAATKKKKVVQAGARLVSQLLIPETYFVSPPCCNIIFPDQYFDFAYSRNFGREVSRLSCQGGLGIFSEGGGKNLFGRYYFAPDIRDVRNQSLKATLTYGARVLLPHEVHSGIIPKFEWVTDGHRWASKAAKESGQSNEFYENDKVAYLQRLANYQFYLHRWSSRNMAVTGVFNPSLVAGFPGVVLDQTFQAVKEAPGVEYEQQLMLGKQIRPTQFMGRIDTIVHSVSQSGGTTSVSLQMCRTHRGVDDEFLGTLLRDKKEMVTVDKTDNIRSNDLFSSTLPPDRVNQIGSIIFAYASRTFKPGMFMAAYGGTITSITPSNFSKGDQSWLASYVGTSDSMWKEILAKYNTAGSGFPTRFLVKYKVRVPTGKIDQVKISIEEALTPGWYSDIWESKNVGPKVYQPLLGTDSITDHVDLKVADQEELADLNFRYGVSYEYKTGAEASALRSDADNTMYVIPGSIEEAIDSLVVMYSIVKEKGYDVHDFIRRWTYRPIANIKEVLGSSTLEYETDTANPNYGRPKFEDMQEGFHSLSFGDYNTGVSFYGNDASANGEVNPQPGKNALFGLFPGEQRNVTRVSLFDNKDKTSIRPEFDPRGKSQLRVRVYMLELSNSHGLKG